ncbi:hypothetical protein ACGF3G_15845 [Streptomyces sp. NPDC048179]|uniref:hypothetical protein n=1 Tax=Streptomyces sp. NPDC048179 TaxID=3365506 RepID=UPI00371F5D18
MKPTIVKSVLGVAAALGVAAEIFEPLGDFLERSHFLGSSLLALVALVIFDAISDPSEATEDSETCVLAEVEEMREHVANAFKARDVHIDFSGFTMESLVVAIRPALRRMGNTRAKNRTLRIRVAIAHMDSPMNLPSSIVSINAPGGRIGGIRHFEDSPILREKIRNEITGRSRRRLQELLNAAQEMNPNLQIDCEIRESPLGPAFKLYVLNDEMALLGLYGIKETELSHDGAHQKILDSSSFRAAPGGVNMIAWSRRSSVEVNRKIFEHCAEWFDRLWDLLGRVSPPPGPQGGS